MTDESPELVNKWLATAKPTYPIASLKDGSIVFRGGIDDSRDEAGVKRRHLAEAIKEVLAGKPVSVTTAKVPG